MQQPTFSQKVYEATRKIPRGKVATYGQIARLVGDTKAMRAVGNALHKNPYAPVVPCHRVVNARGFLAVHFGVEDGIKTQKKRLEKEGITIEWGYKVDLTKYGWRV